jgi:ACS family tartrate transporter-like MFS transporter
MRTIFVRLLPLIVILSVVVQLDRSSIGFAALTMNKDLGLTPYAFGLIAGVFALGYILFEIPSNLVLYRVGANKWFALIMLAWGLALIAMGFVHDANGLYATRFLLGVFESGFNPGLTMYVIFWVPLRYRARFIVLFVLAVPLAGVIGGPIANLFFQLNGIGGLAGWRWLFIGEGVLPVLLVYPTYKFLTPKPQDATWLGDRERTWLIRELDVDAGAVLEHSRLSSALSGLTNWRVWVIGLLYIGIVGGLYGVNIWMPTILKSLGTLSILETTLIVSFIWACAGVVAYLWGAHADRRGGHYVNLAIPLLVGGIGFLLSAFSSGSPQLSILFLIVATSGLVSALTVYWVVPGLFLTGAAVASGMALANSMGNLGGFLGPFLIGWIKQATGSFQNGLIVLSAGMLLAGCISLAIRPRHDPSLVRAAEFVNLKNPS